MKYLSMMIPAYLPRAYVGATPTPYMSNTVDNFERELVKLTGYLIRHGNTTRLIPDPAGRFVSQQIVTRYDLMIDHTDKAMGDAIVLALKTFGLEKVAVIFSDSDVAEVAMPEALEIQSCLHPWNGADEQA